MNIRTIERSVAKFEGRPLRSGAERGTTGTPKGAAQPIRRGFRDNVEAGRHPRPAPVQRVTLPALHMAPKRPGLLAALASKVRNLFRRAVA